MKRQSAGGRCAACSVQCAVVQAECGEQKCDRESRGEETGGRVRGAEHERRTRALIMDGTGARARTSWGKRRVEYGGMWVA